MVKHTQTIRRLLPEGALKKSYSQIFLQTFQKNTHEGALKLKIESKIFNSALKDSAELVLELIFNTPENGYY